MRSICIVNGWSQSPNESTLVTPSTNGVRAAPLGAAHQDGEGGRIGADLCQGFQQALRAFVGLGGFHFGHARQTKVCGIGCGCPDHALHAAVALRERGCGEAGRLGDCGKRDGFFAACGQQGAHGGIDDGIRDAARAGHFGGFLCAETR